MRYGSAMADSLVIAKAGDVELALLPGLANRHGLISGATGTGKTVTLQTLAERFSAIGVPVFMADVKGDLSGMARRAAATPRSPSARSSSTSRSARAVSGRVLGRARRTRTPCPGHGLGSRAAAARAHAGLERHARGRADPHVQNRRRRGAAAARRQRTCARCCSTSATMRPSSPRSTATSRPHRSARSSAGCSRSRRKVPTGFSASRC